MVCWSRADIRRLWREDQTLEGSEVRNTVIITIAFQLLFTAFNALQNLHSSLHDEEFLGLTCLAIIYATATVSSVLAPAIIAKVGAKAVLVMAFGAHCLYILANLYPSFKSMAPVAVILGFFHGPAWTCQSLYVTACAFSYSRRSSSSPYNVLSRFNSLFFGVLASTQVAGNLMTSTVIRDGVGNISDTIVYEFCGANDCPANENATEIGDPETWVIDTTLGVLLGCALLGLFLVVFLLIPLPRSEVVQHVTLQHRLASFFRVVMTTDMILLAPFMLFSSVQHAFLVSVFTKAYVACPIGIHNVGFVMASYGATTPVFIPIFGQLSKVTGRFPLLVSSLMTTMALLVFLFEWAPSSDDRFIMYVIAIVWGVVESILLAQANALIAMLWPENKEAAFANYHAWRSLGYTISFANSTYMCVSTKLILCILLVGGALPLYIFVEIKAKIQERREFKTRPETSSELGETGEEEEESEIRDIPSSPGAISTISLQFSKERHSFDFLELSDIMKEAETSWSRIGSSPTLDLPKVMSREYLQHSKVTTWFHTVPTSLEEILLNTVNFAISEDKASPTTLPRAMSVPQLDPSHLPHHRDSDVETSKQGQSYAKRPKSESYASGMLPLEHQRAIHMVALRQTRRQSVFQKLKAKIPSPKRLSLHIPDTNPFRRSSSPRLNKTAVSSPGVSSGYGSQTTLSFSHLPGVPQAASVADTNHSVPNRRRHRHSVDIGTITRFETNLDPESPEVKVIFGLGTPSPTVENVKNPFLENPAMGRSYFKNEPIVEDEELDLSGSNVTKHLNKLKPRDRGRRSSFDGVINTAFSGDEEMAGLYFATRAHSSRRNSDGFVDDEEDEGELFDDDFHDKLESSASSPVRALKKKRKKILTQSEDVSAIY